MAAANPEGTLVSRHGRKHLLVQGILCTLCMLVGAFYPTLLDWSKTAIQQKTVLVDRTLVANEQRAYPFSPISVVVINDALQLSIALCAVAGKEGLHVLWQVERAVLFQMMPLGAIYALGELLTLRAVQKGSGPVYVVIANMKLAIAALMSRAVFGRAWSMPWLHWLELVLISAAAAAYTLTEAGSLGAQWHWEGAWMALAKSTLVAFSSVFCEHTYKSNKFLVVLTLQALWGLITIVVLIGASFAGIAAKGLAQELHDDAGAVALFGSGPRLPLCTSEDHTQCLQSLSQAAAAAGSGAAVFACSCLTRRGWDAYTLLAVFADLSNAISSALVFKRLSAVAKYVCRATSAVPMYLFYCAVGRSHWDFRVFFIVLFLCVQVSAYTVQRHTAATQAEAAKAGDWAQHYEKSGSIGGGETGEDGLRRRTSTPTTGGP
uniref:Uncharacterized protein n=1 Tax=Pyrodinium bahamense TaxID=73915 RepID=A0A6T8XV32_9DINO|mmetsp:Transcript_38065/g.105910  ORF Transcript_38065/g.105910 Transcript_38065/m.105910 type:complete len:434 (+) Transcript_38065:1434-2735(+)